MPTFLSILKFAVATLSRTRDKYEALRLKQLIARGLVIGKNVYINRNVNFDASYPYLIEIQDNCRISTGVRFMTHDATTSRPIGVTRVAKVCILEGTFIGECALILPGVTIGPNALIAAGSVVNRDIGEDMCAAGNPARPYGKFSELLERYRKKITEETIFDMQDVDNGEVTIEEIRRLCDVHGNIYLRGKPDFDPRNTEWLSRVINMDLAALEQQHRNALEKLSRMRASLSRDLSETDKAEKGGTQP